MFIVSEFNLKISEHDCIVGLIEIIIYLCTYPGADLEGGVRGVSSVIL
jgi:hypothetical protein